MREAAHRVEGAAGGVLQPAEAIGHGVGVGPDERAHRAELHRQAGQGRPDPVVQVAPQPPAFLLPRHHQPVPAGAQRVGEQHRLDGHAAVPARGRRAGPAPRSRSRRPGATVTVPIRAVPETRSTLRRLPAPGPLAPAVHVPGGLDLAPRHAQRRGDRRGQSRSRTASTLGAVWVCSASRCSAAVGIAQVAVEQPVHQRGEARAQRMDREGRAARDHGDAEVGQVLPEQAEHRRHQDREPGDQRRSSTV